MCGEEELGGDDMPSSTRPAVPRLGDLPALPTGSVPREDALGTSPQRMSPAKRALGREAGSKAWGRAGWGLQGIERAEFGEGGRGNLGFVGETGGSESGQVGWARGLGSALQPGHTHLAVPDMCLAQLCQC